MAPRPDRPADDPSPDGDERGEARGPGSPDVPVTDEQWAAIVAELQGGPGPADPQQVRAH